MPANVFPGGLSSALAGAPPGATLVLAEGTYESVNVESPITLAARCGATVILEGVAIAGKESGEVVLLGVVMEGPLMVSAGPELRARGLLMRDPGLSSVRVFDHGRARISHSHFVWSAPPSAAALGLAVDRASLELQTVTVEHAPGYGVLVTGPAAVRLSDVAILETQPRGEDQEEGIPLGVDGAASVWISGLRIEGGLEGGLVVYDATLRGGGLAITDISPRVSDGAAGQGLSAIGADIELFGLAVTRVHQAGVLVESGAHVALADWLVQDIRPTVSVLAGYGAKVDDATLTVLRGRATACHRAGIFVHRGHLFARELTIDGTKRGGSTQKPGHGLLATGGARVRLERAHLTLNQYISLMANGTGTRVMARDLVIQRTAPVGDFGYGFESGGGASLTVIGARLHKNHTVAGMTAPGSRLRMVGVLLTGNVSMDSVLPESEPTRPAETLAVKTGADAELLAVHLADNARRGLAVSGEGARVRARGLVIERTLPTPKRETGLALHLMEGGALDAESAWLTESRAAAIGVYSGAELRLRDAHVEATGSSAAFNGRARAIEVAGGSRAALAGVRLSGSADVGAYVSSHGELTLAGAIVEDTEPNASGYLGVGVFVADSARVALRSSVVRHHHGAGVTLHRGAGLVEGSVVHGVTAAWYDKPRTGNEKLADAFLAFAANEVELRRSVFVGTPRAGILLSDCPGVVIENNLSSLNAFGVMIRGGTSFDVESENGVFDNIGDDYSFSEQSFLLAGAEDALPASQLSTEGAE